VFAKQRTQALAIAKNQQKYDVSESGMKVQEKTCMIHKLKISTNIINTCRFNIF